MLQKKIAGNDPERKIHPTKALLNFFSAVLDDFDREAEGKRKSDTLPKRAVLKESNQHHNKAKQAHHYGQGIFFREIFFHDSSGFDDGFYTRQYV